MVTIAYQSYAQKAIAYVEQTIPAIFAVAFGPSIESEKALRRWMRANISTKRKAFQLKQLHDAARAGKYVGENLPQDEIRTLVETLAIGGDCEDWAALLLAGCRVLGIKAQLATSGNAQDNFQHVYVRAMGFVIDPKGDQSGVAFNRNSERNPIRRYWELDPRDGNLIEVHRE